MIPLIPLGLLILVIIWLIFFLRAIRRKLIAKIDDLGVTTKSGKYYLWSNLDKIEYRIMQNRKGNLARVHSIKFHFKDGIASVGHLMPIITQLNEKANQLQVPKTEKLVGYYR